MTDEDQWRSVKDLPKQPGWVLCWDENCADDPDLGWGIAFFGYFKKPNTDGPGEPIFNGFHWATHWMPRPKPPSPRRLKTRWTIDMPSYSYTVQKLAELRACAARACEAAQANRAHFEDEVVNWSNFKPFQVEWFISEEGQTGYNVFIDEAAPNNPEVHAFIDTFLVRQGWDDVTIYFEW